MTGTRAALTRLLKFIDITINTLNTLGLNTLTFNKSYVMPTQCIYHFRMFKYQLLMRHRNQVVVDLEMHCFL
jgi:hypothetical protein